MSQPNPTTQHLLYEVNDSPPHRLAASLAAQTVALVLTGIALTPIIALSAVGLVDTWADWVVFAALVISGSTTILQAQRLGPFGAGHVLFMGTSGAFLAVSIAAMEAGGLPLLGTLVLVSALVQFALAARLSLFRSIITPTVGGTVICLIAVTVMPHGFKLVSEVPSGFDASPVAPAITAITTTLVILALSFYTNGKTRLWAPLVGVSVGFAVAFPLGLVDLSAVAEAGWLGLPDDPWPGLDLSFDRAFWLLLPAFVIVTVVGALETYGDGIAIQDISSRSVKTTDFRVVQGAVNADGLGNFLSGLACTLPNTTYSTSISVVDLTGVAARRVGVYGGVFLLVLAFVPKLSALLQSIPAPVAGAFIFVFLVLLFAHGIRLVVSEGMSFDNGLVFGVSLWLGVGFQNQQIFAGLLPEFLSSLLNNGMTAGGISAVLLSWMVSLKRPRATRLSVPLQAESVAGMLDHISEHAMQRDWRNQDLSRLLLIAEEAFVFLLENAQTPNAILNLKLAIDSNAADIELVGAAPEVNLETALRERGESSASPDAVRLGILSHMVEQLRHEQFNNADFLTLKVVRRVSAPRID